ncbi:MAG TPA: SGNH/GDSL hydrolase family protein [Gemmatimonadales bacterium]|nr:SGNH/GDSL hydrolase family protein [Gemmatimonadales bacterium]
MTRGGLRARLLAAAVLAGVTLATLVVVELVLRQVLPGSRLYLVHLANSRRFFAPLPEFVPGVSDTAHFDTNAFGIRGPDFGPDAREYRVLAIGGSTTECAMLDQPETWTALVARAIPSTRDGRQVWVGNVGRSGLTSRDHVVEMKYFVPQLPPLNLVVIMVGINDLTSALKQGYNYHAPAPVTDSLAERVQISRTFAVVPGPFHRPGTEFLLSADAPWYKATALWQLAKRARIRLNSTSLVQDPEGRNYEVWRSHRRNAKLLDSLPDLGPALAEYTRNLEGLADLAAARHLRLVLMTQPTLWSPTLPDSARRLLWMGGTGEFQVEAGHDYFTVPALRTAMDRYNAALLEVCGRRQLPCLDLAAAIPHETRWFYDDVHYTEAGARLVARQIAAHLAAIDSTLPAPVLDSVNLH